MMNFSETIVEKTVSKYIAKRWGVHLVGRIR